MKRPGIPEVGTVAAWFRGPVCCCQSHCPISTVVLKTTAGFCHVIIPTETLIDLRFSGPHYQSTTFHSSNKKACSFKLNSQLDFTFPSSKSR